MSIPDASAGPGLNGRLDSLTGLRFAAALAVFGVHTSGMIANTPLRMFRGVLEAGGVGVSFFFVLSGFVLTWSLHPHDTSAAFYRRRAARILPAYWAAWFVGLAVTYSEGVDPSAVSLAASFSLLQSWWPDEATYFAVNGPSWSLSCEAFFYLLSPWLLVRVARVGGRDRRRALVALTALTMLVALAGWGAEGDVRFWAVTIFPPARLSEFVLGALLAGEVARGTWPRVSLRTAGVVALGTMILAGVVGAGASARAFTLVPFLLLIAAAAGADCRADPSPFRHRILVQLGVWSYSFYLVHELVIRSVRQLGADGHSVGALLVEWPLILAASIAAAALLSTVVERPLERRLRPQPAGGRHPVT